ncbi:MAG: O-sialoglycoprotein endopeptidase [Firmicutes bacterium]|nr:O-sialoglycoprotein endopeptidase [Bacillota bacterium]
MFLGIDTSCYTTSLAIVDDQGRLLADERQLLAVKQGERGLRQSEGLFMHVQNLPELAAAVKKKLPALKLKAVAASDRPRPVQGSYMPVFTAGASFGRTLASLLQLPYWNLSHQEGHILAGIWSAGVSWTDFYVLHVSGGTTELLAVKLAGRIEIKKLGGSADLHAGQFIDRIGVALGLPFPAGPALEKLAQTAAEPIRVPVAVKDGEISFSGPESHVQRLVAAKKATPAAIARGVEHCIGKSLLALIENMTAAHGQKPVLFVGGVMANNYICRLLRAELGELCAFARTVYAGDNAVGAALFARQKFTAQAGYEKGRRKSKLGEEIKHHQ